MSPISQSIFFISYLQTIIAVYINLNIELLSNIQLSSSIRNTFRNLQLNTNLLYKEYYITIPICLGDPSSCYKILYDISSAHLWVTLDNHKSSNLIMSRIFKNSSSLICDSNNIIKTVTKYFNIEGVEMNDLVHLKNDKEVYDFLFSFVGANKTEVYLTNNNYHFDGVLGLSRTYDPISINNKSRFSLIHSLYDKGFIKQKIFAHVFDDNYRKGKLFLGETGIYNDESYHQCFCINYFNNTVYNNILDLSSVWNCPIDYIQLSHDNNILSFQLNSSITKNEYIAIFDSVLYGVELPFKIVQELYENYIIISQGLCFINTSTQIQCPRTFNYSLFPEIILKMQEVILIISPHTLFDLHQEPINNTYTAKINITNTNFLRIGLIVLRNYHMIFDYDQNSIGFYQKNTDQWSKFTMIIVSLFGLFILIIMTKILYHNSLSWLEESVRRSHSMKSFKNSIELLDKRNSQSNHK